MQELQGLCHERVVDDDGFVEDAGLACHAILRWGQQQTPLGVRRPRRWGGWHELLVAQSVGLPRPHVRVEHQQPLDAEVAGAHAVHNLADDRREDQTRERQPLPPWRQLLPGEGGPQGPRQRTWLPGPQHGQEVPERRHELRQELRVPALEEVLVREQHEQVVEALDVHPRGPAGLAPLQEELHALS
eukprot:9607449-Lingulodinium_polyedra.AAC.1